MRHSDWIEEKAVTCIKNLFLDKNLYSQLSVNDKTEHIDGYVYIENEINNIFNLNLNKIEVQIKGRTNSKRVVFKESFIEYCKTNIVPVIVFLVNFNSDKSIEGIYYKYINGKESRLSDGNYSVIFNNNDKINDELPIERFLKIQNIHWSKIVERVKNNEQLKTNKEMHFFMNKVVRSINAFLYGTMNKYMESKFSDIERFAIVYCGNKEEGISYAIMPLLKDNNISSDLIEVSTKYDMISLGITKIYSRGINYSKSYESKLVKDILKKVIIPLIVNEEEIISSNKELAIRSIYYYTNEILREEKIKLRQNDNKFRNINYSDHIKELLLSNKTIFNMSDIRKITDVNVRLINSKLETDFNFFKNNFDESDYVFFSECNDNKYRVSVKNNNIESIKIIKKSKYLIVKRLLEIIDEDYKIDLSKNICINGFFSCIEEIDDYINTKYEFLCYFFNTYVNCQSREYVWNTCLHKINKDYYTGSEKVKVYYSIEWSNHKDSKITFENEGVEIFNDKRLIYECNSAVPLYPYNKYFKAEPLIQDIYNEISHIIFELIDDYFKCD